MGHLVGQHTRIRKAGLATGIGALLVMAGLELIGLIPLIGDLVAMGILTAALGAVVITYLWIERVQSCKAAGVIASFEIGTRRSRTTANSGDGG